MAEEMEEQKDSKSTNSTMGATPGTLLRRSFLTRVGTGATVLGAAAALAPGSASAQTPGDSRFQPARHALDDWMDQASSKHRLVFDTTTADGVSSASLYASNFFTANQSGYTIKNDELAVMIVMRHSSTPFAYNDAIWAKYGVPISNTAKFVDPQTQMPPIVNVYKKTLDGLIKQGVNFAVCMMATRNYAGAIARSIPGSNTDMIYDEIVANLIGNAHMVPAGIVAVSRAQERGYTFVHAV